MSDGYERAALADLETNPEKPGERWELSPALDIPNYNVAVIGPGTRLSQGGYHRRENQREFFHVVEGRCRVEVEAAFVRSGGRRGVRFDPGVPTSCTTRTTNPAR